MESAIPGSRVTLQLTKLSMPKYLIEMLDAVSVLHISCDNRRLSQL